jgi:hypothetical protein
MGKKSRTKGHSFEREISARLRVVFPNARRQLEYHIDDCQGVDIANTGRYKFQCKKLKRYAPITCIAEVVCDRALGDVPVLVTAGDNKEPVVVLPFDDFLALLQSAMRKGAR